VRLEKMKGKLPKMSKDDEEYLPHQVKANRRYRRKLKRRRVKK